MLFHLAILSYFPCLKFSLLFSGWFLISGTFLCFSAMCFKKFFKSNLYSTFPGIGTRRGTIYFSLVCHDARFSWILYTKYSHKMGPHDMLRQHPTFQETANTSNSLIYQNQPDLENCWRYNNDSIALLTALWEASLHFLYTSCFSSKCWFRTVNLVWDCLLNVLCVLPPS